MKTCGCNKPCGCGENVYSQNSTCSGYPSCDYPELCSETHDGACVVYTGEEIVNLTVPKGARLNEIVQRLVGAITNPGCNYPDSPCKSPIVTVKKVTNNKVDLVWGTTGATSYQVEYRHISAVNWTLNTAISGLSDSIGGLGPDSTYLVRVRSGCSSGSCYSVTLSITTKS